ncbi:branched-chain amino acid transport system ATP-binding protein/branched-chain amino acid transport system permease protein [Asanoa hainanensis]|uniref:Branched-chain amino acid transport system ATP-binding protein/branched-chain amino acid transport system permease protein n=1 Tax=Asanoa hainanensis TaxID=560556 RepID=A0A239NLZ6_9ACTN|nr:ABC transporter ATP-binding protein [Asanoa hainanensis]SNT55129.1 branched-chain amino acid transport system ATP-binding protein/branched-chain amino acid transport system permease protein [Asanoa hainanensis]
MTLLRVENLAKSFKGLRAVDDVSFEVTEGSILGVIGPNGAGKTTMFNLVAGALRPDTGRVHLGGKEITGHAPHRITAAGMTRTFQLMRPFYSMTVLENVTVAVLAGGAAKRTAREAAAEVIARVGLDRWRDSPTEGLPTAALKRLELARALASKPRVLLLDEVLAGLVPAERAPVMELLERLRTEDGVTLVFVEHIMAAVMRLSDSVLVLDLGRVLTSGAPEAVTRDPRVIEAYLGEDPHAQA